jgi:hypothetical protein
VVCCGTCLKSHSVVDGQRVATRYRRALQFNAHCSPDYVKHLLQGDPAAMMLLSCLDIGVNMRRRMNGFVSGNISSDTCFMGSLIRYDAGPANQPRPRLQVGDPAAAMQTCRLAGERLPNYTMWLACR